MGREKVKVCNCCRVKSYPRLVDFTVKRVCLFLVSWFMCISYYGEKEFLVTGFLKRSSESKMV